MALELSRSQRRLTEFCLARNRARRWLEIGLFCLLAAVIALLVGVFYRFAIQFDQLAAGEHMTVRQALHFDLVGALPTTEGQARLILLRGLLPMSALAILAIASTVMFGIMIIQRHVLIQKLGGRLKTLREL